MTLIGIISLFHVSFSSGLILVAERSRERPTLVYRADDLFCGSCERSLIMDFRRTEILSSDIGKACLRGLGAEDMQSLVFTLNLSSRRLDSTSVGGVVGVIGGTRDPC